MSLKPITKRTTHRKRSASQKTASVEPSSQIVRITPKAIDVDAFFKRLKEMPPLSEETIRAIEETVELRKTRPRRR